MVFLSSNLGTSSESSAACLSLLRLSAIISFSSAVVKELITFSAPVIILIAAALCLEMSCSNELISIFFSSSRSPVSGMFSL